MTSTPKAPGDLTQVAPTLERLTQEVLLGDVWSRPDLSPADRSLITLAALVATGKATQMQYHVTQALDHGITAQAISGLLTHAAFYCGWPNIWDVAGAVEAAFATAGIASPTMEEAPLLEIDPEAEAKREATIAQAVAPTSPGFAKDTNDVLFGYVWRQPDLSKRERSLATVAILITLGQPDQLTFHVSRAMDNGVSAAELGEIISHLAYYAGWPRLMSALPVVKQVLLDREASQD